MQLRRGGQDTLCPGLRQEFREGELAEYLGSTTKSESGQFGRQYFESVLIDEPGAQG